MQRINIYFHLHQKKHLGIQYIFRELVSHNAC